MSVRKAFTKDRKFNKGKIADICYSGFELNEGDIGLKAITSGRVTEKQIETMRRVINKIIDRKGKLIIKAYPHRSITKKPTEVRMGTKKGSIDHYVAIVSGGFIIVELCGVEREIAIKALEAVQYKLPIRTKIVERLI